jgi:poly(3-hydroxybutyrate) depolymerase
VLATGAVFSSCGTDLPGADSGGSAASSSEGLGHGRLRYRPSEAPSRRTSGTGRLDLQGAAGAEPAAVYVPAEPGREPLRLVLVFHGAGGVPGSALALLRDEADRRRLLLVAPKSVGATWDVIRGGYGADLRNIDRLLGRLADRYRLRGHTVGGFSDGASYALSVGITNGDVFDSVIAFSPGFHAAGTAHGRPRFFVSHGTRDDVLPIDRCSRRIVPELEGAGYPVDYQEFDGGHTVPPAIRTRAAQWLDEGLLRSPG